MKTKRIHILKLTKNITLTIAPKYHMVFWALYFSFNVLRWGSYFNDYWYSLKSNLVEFPIHILVVYFNVYFLIPKLILKKRYKLYLFSLILMLVFVYLTRTSLNYILVTKEIWPEAENAGRFLELNHIIAVVLGELYVIAFVTAIKLLVDWTIEINKNKKLAKLQLDTELKLLRSQIQPHFFFNTLNNLYALTLKKSDDAPKLILKLSKMMHYVLYKADSAKTSLIDEINYINNYIDIKQLRFKDVIDFKMEISGNIEDVEVAPLIFLSFVENSFKHGLKESNRVTIAISFKIIDNNYLEFIIKNSFNPDSKRENKQGIGLINAKRRLKLLYYKDFVFSTEEKGKTYILYLKIPVK